MKLMIISDGRSTRVIDSLTGETVDNVTKVTFVHETGKPLSAQIEMIFIEVDLVDVHGKIKNVA